MGVGSPTVEEYAKNASESEETKASEVTTQETPSEDVVTETTEDASEANTEEKEEQNG